MTELLKDNDPKRATYNIAYPIKDSLITFENKEEFKRLIENNSSISDSKILFKYDKAYNDNCTFDRCQFYIDSEDEKIITQITFRNCKFNFCFMGSVFYKNVRFENAQFKNCDFSNSIFKSCVFDNCDFENCSAYHPDLINTEIDPLKFLTSICFFSQNYSEPIEKNKQEFIYMKFILAKKIYNSNNSIDNHIFSDIGLYELKKNELIYLKSIYKSSMERKGMLDKFKLKFFMLFQYLNLKLTNGGTSLGKLLVWIFGTLLVFNLYFFKSRIQEPNYYTSLSNNCLVRFFEWLPKTLSIFLAYGYTAFKTNDCLNFLVINLCTFLGTISYAMIISILVRKIYK